MASSEERAELAQGLELVSEPEDTSTELAQMAEPVLMRVEAGKRATELTELRDEKDAVTEVTEAVMELMKELTEEREEKEVWTTSQVEFPAATEPVTTGSNEEEDTNWAEAQAAIASSARVKRTVRIVNRTCARTTD